nr:hypothetical protein 11 [Pseudomonadaceae bacterium]
MDSADRFQHLADAATKIAKASGIGTGTTMGVTKVIEKAETGADSVGSVLVQHSEVIFLSVGIGGFMLSAATFLMSWYYNHKRTKLMEQAQSND